MTLGRAPKALAASRGLAFCACRGVQAHSSARLTLPACDIFHAPVLVQVSLTNVESNPEALAASLAGSSHEVRDFSDRRLGPAGCPDGAHEIPDRKMRFPFRLVAVRSLRLSETGLRRAYCFGIDAQLLPGRP